MVAKKHFAVNTLLGGFEGVNFKVFSSPLGVRDIIPQEE